MATRRRVWHFIVVVVCCLVFGDEVEMCGRAWCPKLDLTGRHGGLYTVSHEREAPVDIRPYALGRLVPRLKQLYSASGKFWVDH